MLNILVYNNKRCFAYITYTFSTSLLFKLLWKLIYASNVFVVNVIRSAMSHHMKLPNMRRYFTDPFGRKGLSVWSIIFGGVIWLRQFSRGMNIGLIMNLCSDMNGPPLKSGPPDPFLLEIFGPPEIFYPSSE